MKRFFVLLITLALLVSLCAIPASANATDYILPYSIYIEKSPFLIKYDCLIDGVCYVPVRSFVKRIVKEYSLQWDAEENCAVVTAKGLKCEIGAGKNYILSNGRCFASKNENIIIDGRLYAPLNIIARSLGCTFSYNLIKSTVYVHKTGKYPECAGSYYNYGDLLWLSRIINAESCTEPFLGKVAVGNVVLNRVSSKYYPDTIKEVILEKHGSVYQFSPAGNGTLYNKVSKESRIAAKACLEGFSLSDEICFFIRENIAKSKWVVNNCEYVFSVGNHDFYS